MNKFRSLGFQFWYGADALEWHGGKLFMTKFGDLFLSRILVYPCGFVFILLCTSSIPEISHHG